MTHCDLYPAVSLSPPFAPKVGDLVGFYDHTCTKARLIPATILEVATWRNSSRYLLALHNTAPDCNRVRAWRAELAPLTGSLGGMG